MSRDAVLFQGVTMDFRGVFKQSPYVQNKVQYLQNVWQKRGICELDLVQICTNPRYPPEEKTKHEQPAIFIVSLTRLWELEETFKADVFAGHSFGEYAAICASGVVTPEDGYRITQFRGKLACEVNHEHPGLMAAVNGNLNLLDIQRICQTCNIDIANINSPEQVVVSGERSSLEIACKKFEQEGLKVIPLETGAPFHSRHFATKKPVLRTFLRSLQFRPPKTKLLMNATTSLETDPQRIKDCLVAQLVNPVNFPKIVRSMQEIGTSPEHVQEVGSRSVLKGFMKRILREN